VQDAETDPEYQEVEAAGGTPRRQRVRSQLLTDYDRIHHIIKLLKYQTKEKGQTKVQYKL